MTPSTTTDNHVEHDGSMRLPEGRILSYTDLGPRGAPVVMYFHGAPSSRLDLALLGLESNFMEMNVRVVSPDRPGYGGSSPHPGRRLDDWPTDVAALADHLGVRRFAVIGASSGGPYAVVCAALLPARVVGAGVVAGVTDMGWAPAWEGLDEHEATIMRIGDETSAAAWCAEHLGPDGSGFLEEFSDLSDSDAKMLQDETNAAAFATTMSEAFRQGVAGYAQDITVQGRPWSFETAAIIAPVRILHGDADTIVAIAHGRHSAELIPNAELVTFPDHGHLSILAEIPQLCAALVEPLR